MTLPDVITLPLLRCLYDAVLYCDMAACITCRADFSVRPSNERRRYFVTTSLIGRVHA